MSIFKALGVILLQYKTFETNLPLSSPFQKENTGMLSIKQPFIFVESNACGLPIDVGIACRELPT